MHKLLSLALPAMLALSLAPQLAMAQPADLTAAQVIEKSRATYAGFTTYKGTCVMASDYTTTDGKAGGAKAGGVNAGTIQNVAGARASIEFTRGQRLDVTGVDTGGHQFHALSTPAQSWIEVFPQADAGQPQAAGGRDFILANGDLSAAQLMVASLTGITGGTGALIPDALVGNPWNMPFPRWTDAALRPDEKVGGANCYVVSRKTRGWAASRLTGSKKRLSCCAAWKKSASKPPTTTIPKFSCTSFTARRFSCFPRPKRNNAADRRFY